jgi:hypothetical protein
MASWATREDVMDNDDRMVKAILAVGVLNALVADGAKLWTDHTGQHDPGSRGARE